MKVCKNCGEINPNDFEFCCNCGKNSFVLQEETTCPNCGATNDKSFEHCINCGKPLRPASEVPQGGETNVAVETQNPDGYTPIPVDLRAQLSDVYGGVTVSTPSETAQCPSCGAMVPIHAIYCQKCGAPVEKLHDHRVVKRKICPHCGRENSLEAHFCAYCFCTLANAKTQEMQVVHDAKQVGNEMIKQAYLEDEHGKKKICANCGALNKPDELFCVNCGFKLDAEEMKKYCPNCGAENAIDVTFCTKCQWSFDGSTPDSISKWVCSQCENLNDGKNEFCVVCGAKKGSKGKGGK